MTFKNTSSAVFQDGDLIVAPGESFSTEDQARIDQMQSQYKWQFDETKGKAPTEGEVKAAGNDVREIRSSSHVQLDDEGNQAEVVGSPEPAK